MRARVTAAGVAAFIVASTGIVSFTLDAARARERDWMPIVRDSDYTVAIDTTNITRKFGRAYVAWYRTDHAEPHAVKGAVFNRELVQAIVLCDRAITFKIASVDLSLGNARAVSSQRTSSAELYRQKWRAVEGGGVEDEVAKATCEIAREGR